MKSLPLLGAIAILLAVLLGWGMVAVSAQTRTEQAFVGGGGMIRGTVYGFTMYDTLTPIEWAPVTAANGQYSFVAYTGSGGGYEMFVPVGVYNVTVLTPGYKAYSQDIAVSDGSTSSINFYLEQSGVPVPEFQPSAFAIVLFVALASVLLAKRAGARKRK